MGRIRKNIKINGHDCWTLFDTGARNTYIIFKIAKDLPIFELKNPEPVNLGGKTHHVTKNCWLEAYIKELPIRCHARVLDEIGKDENGKEIEILIGPLTMQEWGIALVPEKEELDMSNYPKEFVEF